MTEKKNTVDDDAIKARREALRKQIEAERAMPASEREALELARAAEVEGKIAVRDQAKEGGLHALRKLDNSGFADVVLQELDRRRCNYVTGGTMDAPGQYTAAASAVLALLGLDESPLAGRLAAVGRGARLLSKSQEWVNSVRELAQWVEAFTGRGEPAPVTAEQVEQLSKTLDEKYDDDLPRNVIAAALSRKSFNGRVAALAFATGVAQGDAENEFDFRDVAIRVGKALAE